MFSVLNNHIKNLYLIRIKIAIANNTNKIPNTIKIIFNMLDKVKLGELNAEVEATETVVLGVSVVVDEVVVDELVVTELTVLVEEASFVFVFVFVFDSSVLYTVSSLDESDVKFISIPVA